MEVHAHTHTPRKKWTHYLWEFLMLFLAVFCGFLAENQREHVVESQRAKEYAKSLLSDLKEDTAEISGGIRQNAFMVSAMDSCISIGMKKPGASTIPGTFYYYSRFASNAYSIDWNASTLTQLLQSGNLRYFRNKELVTKINKYYASENLISKNNETDFIQRNHISEIRSRLLLANQFIYFASSDIGLAMKGHVPDDTLDQLMSQQLSLKQGNANIMNEFLNNVEERKIRNKRFVEELYPKALNAASEIIELLKKEYHLD
jgi:hypothetical protein